MRLQGCGREICRDKDCVYLIYLCFPQQPTESLPGTEKVVQKHLLVTILLLFTGIIITAHPSAVAQRQGVGDQEGERLVLFCSCRLRGMLRGPVLQGSLK